MPDDPADGPIGIRAHDVREAIEDFLVRSPDSGATEVEVLDHLDLAYTELDAYKHAARVLPMLHQVGVSMPDASPRRWRPRVDARWVLARIRRYHSDEGWVANAWTEEDRKGAGRCLREKAVILAQTIRRFLLLNHPGRNAVQYDGTIYFAARTDGRWRLADRHVCVVRGNDVVNLDVDLLGEPDRERFEAWPYVERPLGESPL
jgi:hypothetical protein